MIAKIIPLEQQNRERRKQQNAGVLKRRHMKILMRSKESGLYNVLIRLRIEREAKK